MEVDPALQGGTAPPQTGPQEEDTLVLDPAMKAAGASSAPQQGATPAAPATPTAATGRGRSAAARNPRDWAALYQALAAACAALALACLLAPRLVGRILFGSSADPLDDQHDQLLQLNGGALLVAAATAAALALAGRGAADGGGLGRGSSDLLRLALAGQGLANALTFLYYGWSFRSFMLPLELVVNGAAFAVPAADLMQGAGLRGSVSELVRRLRSLPRGDGLPLAYHALALAFPAFGAALFYLPRYSLSHLLGYAYGASTFLLAKLAGVADKALIPTALLVLKEAAQRGGLGSPAARALNGGLLAAGLVHMRVLLPILAMRHGGWMLPINIATWAASILASTAGLALGYGRRTPRTAEPAGTGLGEATSPVKQE